jgi:precorrin-3B synthase
MPSPFNAASVDEFRRGACPALSAPMQTGDGLLARIALTEAITPAAFQSLARLALKHGNGMLDISARGNLQVRGLSPQSAPLLDVDVRALALPLRDGLAVETPPLAGLDPDEITDPRPLAAEIAVKARNLSGLAPKMSVVVDGHGQLTLATLMADIRLVAVRSSDSGAPAQPILWKILLGGIESSGHIFAALPAAEAVAATIGLLEKLSDLGPKARGRDLANPYPRNAETMPAATSPLGLHHVTAKTSAGKPRPSATDTIGTCTIDSCAMGIGLPYGQIHAERLIALAGEATRLGIAALKPALDHSILAFGDEPACLSLAAFAANHGFIVSGIDPRAHIAACTGSPACASARADTHQLADTAAKTFADLLDGSFKLHVSGCAKGCAHPQASALVLTGTSSQFSLISGGRPGDLPFATVDFADTNATLRRLADLIFAERRQHETSAACIARLGQVRLAAAATSGRP